MLPHCLVVKAWSLGCTWSQGWCDHLQPFPARDLNDSCCARVVPPKPCSSKPDSRMALNREIKESKTFLRGPQSAVEHRQDNSETQSLYTCKIFKITHQLQIVQEKQNWQFACTMGCPQLAVAAAVWFNVHFHSSYQHLRCPVTWWTCLSTTWGSLWQATGGWVECCAYVCACKLCQVCRD